MSVFRSNLHYDIVYVDCIQENPFDNLLEFAKLHTVNKPDKQPTSLEAEDCGIIVRIFR